MAVKDAIGGLTATNFPAALESPAAAFRDRLRDRSILLQLVGLFVAPMRTRSFFHVGATAARVVEGAAIPATTFDLSPSQLLPFTHAGLIVCSNEALRSLIAMQSILDALANAVGEAENYSLLAPDEPDSILPAVATFAGTGGSIAQISADLRRLADSVPGNDPNATFIMSKGSAAYLATLHTTDGSPAFPTVTMAGGTLLGQRVLISQACEVDDSPPSRRIALVQPAGLVVADENRILLSVSQAAAIEQATDPTGDTLAPASASRSFTSMYQSESVAIRAVREVSWLARAGATAFFTTGW